MFSNKAKAVVRITAALLAAVTLSSCLFASGAGKAAGKAADKAAPPANTNRWIYFIRRDDNRLMRSHPDGRDIKQVSPGKVYVYTVAGNWIFYSTYNGAGIYKIHTDGTGNTNISNRIGGVLCVSGSSLLIACGGSSDATAHICRMDLNGKNFRQIGKDELYSDGFKLYNGNIYYASCDYNLSIVKMRPDGSGRKSLTSALADPRNDTFALCGNSLYYINPNKNCNSGIIKRVNLDGKKESFAQINDAFQLGCVDGTLYYQTMDGKTYVMNKDGTGKRAISSKSWVVTRAFNSDEYENFQG